MLSLFKGILSFTFFALNTLFWCVLIYVFVLLKLLSPSKALKDRCSEIMVRIAETWIAGNSWAFGILHNIHWQVDSTAQLSSQSSYLVSANHQSWTDIVVLQHIFNRRIPFLRFFIKQQLKYVPLLGLAWAALDFPMMKRYSKDFLLKHPEKRGEDLETTRRICNRLRGKRISVLNFLEGTRLTASKHQRQESPFQNLLKPKVGGLAFVIEAMGDQFDALLDVTIFYPRGAVSLWGLLKGDMSEVIVEIRQIQIPPELIGGSYLGDPTYREKMQNWVQNLWQEKDQALTRLKASAALNKSNARPRIK